MLIPYRCVCVRKTFFCVVGSNLVVTGSNEPCLNPLKNELKTPFFLTYFEFPSSSGCVAPLDCGSAPPMPFAVETISTPACCRAVTCGDCEATATSACRNQVDWQSLPGPPDTPSGGMLLYDRIMRLQNHAVCWRIDMLESHLLLR